MHLFVNDLTVIDFSYLDDVRGIVGESWIVDIVLVGHLNEQNMVLDFGLVKSQIKRIIDDEFDHKLHIPEESSALLANVHGVDNQDITFKLNGGEHLFVSAPPSAYCFAPTDHISISTLLPVIKSTLMLDMPNNVKDIVLTLRPEKISTPYYHYSHGLKHHEGNCQRIVHGHRSKIDIFVDGEVNDDLQASWAKRWKDIYIGSESDLAPAVAESFCANYQLNADDYYGFAYSASQGDFSLAVAKSMCDLMDRDTTVECIAEFILEQIQLELPDSKLEVRAYEGVSKGAISYA
ncbi:6-carboxytetrahydropterin synthase [Algibacillus agarilyticus]|uniref:6-carboxytetrahydropterin synthase n=1 Tax=Algibacillus agarilyticus TaxID=2234133 RepID=UPI000DD01770|nr:6-carboxytetrahydropterin synthase [Algibacillus agarilyticus]